MSEFHDEWYHHPLIERSFYFVMMFFKYLTSPYVLPIIVFLAMFFIGEMSLAYALSISAITFFAAYKIWVSPEDLDEN
tara:strand:- start:1171 stop:1404 length:234 start_codon:yes stop_codon:yes gene_type:complete